MPPLPERKVANRWNHAAQVRQKALEEEFKKAKLAQHNRREDRECQEKRGEEVSVSANSATLLSVPLIPCTTKYLGKKTAAKHPWATRVQSLGPYCPQGRHG
jgi:hypothetical protein